MVQSKGYQTRTTRFCGAIPRPIAGRLAIAYEDASAEIELANSFSAANAGPPTNPPERRAKGQAPDELCNEWSDGGHHHSEQQCEDRKDRVCQQLGIAATSQRQNP